VLATGLGKSRIIGAVCSDYVARGQRCLVVAHSVVLVDQLVETLLGLGLRVGVEQASRRCNGFPPDVVVGTVQTLQRRRLSRYDGGHFSLVCVDEAHRSLAGQHQRVLEAFPGARVLGVTATPDRTDGKPLGTIYERVAYQRDILWGIENGWLAPITLKTAHTKWDPKALKEVAGEVDAGSAEKAIVEAGVMAEAVTTLVDLLKSERRKSVVAFLPTVASARAFAAELSAQEVRAIAISGSTPEVERERIFAAYKSGEYQVLVNCAVLVEGFDAPHTDCIALLSPTKSRSRLAQCIGRGTRVADGKKDCLVLDFVPGRMKRGRLASPADALAGRELDDDTYDNIADGDLAGSLKAAEKTAEELKELREAAERRESERKERLHRLRLVAQAREAQYSVENHDASGVLGGSAEAPVKPSYHRTAKPEMSDEARRKAGLATLKQAKILERNGFNPFLKRRDANAVIDQIAKNGWKWLGPIPEKWRKRA
jgi:superfamily II DNA or RNA helicase